MSILINIASEFTGKKAFDKADKSVKGLESSTKKLAKTLGVALSTTAVIAYGKAAVKAFAEDEAAAQRLATAVSNIGLSLFTQDVEDFIAKTEQSAAILDDKLRPAMQALITTTGSYTKSQELLNNAITISRASGVDLTTVAQDLANGYVGITKGLKKYNTGLTQTELKTKSFSEVLGVLLTNSAGAAEAYLETTAFKMDSLSVATANAQEKIGSGLVEAFAILGGGSGTADAMKTIDNIAEGINSITKAAAYSVGALVKLYKALDFITSFGGFTGDKGKIATYVREVEAGMNPKTKDKDDKAKAQQQTAAEKAAAKRAKELAALQKKQVAATKALTAEQKKQAALKKAGTIFDLEQIQLIAALKGDLSKEEQDRVRLQLALLTENVSEAQKLTYEIAKAQGLGEQMARNLATLPDAKNPFASWSAYLDMIIEKARLAASAGTVATPPPAMNGSGLDFGGNKIGAPVGGGFAPPPAGTYGGATTVVLELDGKTIASALLDQSLSGNQAYVNRRTGGFE